MYPISFKTLAITSSRYFFKVVKDDKNETETFEILKLDYCASGMSCAAVFCWNNLFAMGRKLVEDDETRYITSDLEEKEAVGTFCSTLTNHRPNSDNNVFLNGDTN